MANSIIVETTAAEIASKVRGLPNLTEDEVLRGMRQIISKLEARVVQNIRQKFSGDHGVGRPPHIPLEDSVLGTVTKIGDLIVGQVSVDEGKEIPYARILEEGGVTSAHLIRPRSAGAISFDKSTISGSPAKKTAPGDEVDVTVQYVRHPGARLAAYHYLLEALQDFQGVIDGDIAASWRRAVMRSGF